MIPVFISFNAVATGISSQKNLAKHFDHKHKLWDKMLHSNVVWINDGSASGVRYHVFKRQTAQLNVYLYSLSRVSEKKFKKWTKSQQLAFLINAYNAFTVKLILSKYPNIRSIKELGSLIRNPWQIEYFELLGKQRNLNYIEHGLIRRKGLFDEPRIHVALVCGSIGCPALRNEAYIAEKLNEQLENSMVRFLSDKTRNRYNPKTDTLEISEIFKWYEDDFINSYGSLEKFLAKYASVFTDQYTEKSNILSFDSDVDFLPYDWTLNDYGETTTKK